MNTSKRVIEPEFAIVQPMNKVLANLTVEDIQHLANKLQESVKTVYDVLYLNKTHERAQHIQRIAERRFVEVEYSVKPTSKQPRS